MTNMRRRKLARLFASMPVAALIWLAWMTLAQAADCPRKGTLGTSRILRVDAATYPRVGIKNYPQTLPLRDHEVVLTFDDGPWPPTTPKVLATLAKECVHATFFLIGKPTSEHPDLARRIAAAGHTIGHHTWTAFQPDANAPGQCCRRNRPRHFRGRNGASWRRHHDPVDAVLPLSRFRDDRRRPSICCNRAALSCSGPICGPATGTR